MHQRYLLRTMANRYEGQTYGYFMVAYWACIVEITTVVFTGYLGLFFPLSIWNSNSGFPLEDIGWATLLRRTHKLRCAFPPRHPPLAGRLSPLIQQWTTLHAPSTSTTLDRVAS